MNWLGGSPARRWRDGVLARRVVRAGRPTSRPRPDEGCTPLDGCRTRVTVWRRPCPTAFHRPDGGRWSARPAWPRRRHRPGDQPDGCFPSAEGRLVATGGIRWWPVDQARPARFRTLGLCGRAAPLGASGQRGAAVQSGSRPLLACRVRWPSARSALGALRTWSWHRVFDGSRSDLSGPGRPRCGRSSGREERPGGFIRGCVELRSVAP